MSLRWLPIFVAFGVASIALSLAVTATLPLNFAGKQAVSTVATAVLMLGSVPLSVWIDHRIHGQRSSGTAALQRLHAQVLAQLGAASAAEKEAEADGRHGDALLNNARADAFDWVLQRIDEAAGR